MNMDGLGAAMPTFGRSPADVGLGDFDTLKNALPKKDTTSPKSPLSRQFRELRMGKKPSAIPNMPRPAMNAMPSGFWNSFPQTPGADVPFVPSKAPPIPKIPKEVSLEVYNRFYNNLGPYIEAWNKYESEVHALRAELKSQSMHVSSMQSLDSIDIVKYMDRVKNKDMVLDESFSKARTKHLDALTSWVRCTP